MRCLGIGTSYIHRYLTGLLTSSGTKNLESRVNNSKFSNLLTLLARYVLTYKDQIGGSDEIISNNDFSLVAKMV